MSSVDLSPEVERFESPFARHRAAVSDGSATPVEALGRPARAESARRAVEPTAEAETAQTRVLKAETAQPAQTRTLEAHSPNKLAGLRAMTGYEEQVVEDQGRWGNTAELCNEILARCVCAPGTDPDDAAKERVRSLSVAERDAELVRLRRITFGDDVISEVDCPACQEVNEVAFDLKQLALDVGPIATQIEVTLSDGRLARMRVPTAGDQAALLDEKLPELAARRTWLLARCTLELAGSLGPFESAAVHAWDSRARRELEAELEGVIPDLDLRMRLTCVRCQHDFSTPFEIESFFLPS